MTESIDDLKREIERLRIAEQLALDAVVQERERSRSMRSHRHFWREYGWPRHDLQQCYACGARRSKETGEVWA